MPNRLAESASPYLKQHENNPIDWFEWSEEAFEKAKREDKPIFLSIGYSSCHWCHVMAHETFEDERVAEFLNRNFVCVKVDREERPDVDEAYMTAVQMISGRGGWPITVFMTPDRKPFFAGTYFPKNDRGQYPGFTTLAQNIADLWRKSRSEVIQSANQIAQALEKTLSRNISSLTSTIPPELFQDCFNALRSEFDGENGGFGGAPKFPSHTALAYLLDYALLQPEAAPKALSMALMTLERMCLGGIHDQVGGGFHRYSTDGNWLLPHFEKMLYDNALLLTTLTRAARLAHELNAPVADVLEQAAIGISDWLKREMMTDDGLFCSALDADSEGEEGLFYLWSQAEVQEILGDRAAAFCEAYGITAEGNYLDEATRQKNGLNILHLKGDAGGAFRNELAQLLERRAKRVRPELDHKALAAWNGMMIVALVEAQDLLPAERAMRGWMQATLAFGELPHQVTLGRPAGHAFLDDYAWMALAAAHLFGATEREEYQEFGDSLVRSMIERFYDQEKGGFFFTSPDHEQLFGRSKPALDQSTPSPNAKAIEACLTYGEVEVAEAALMAVLGWAQKMPSAAESLIHMAMMLTVAKLAEASPGAPPELVVESSQPKANTAKVLARLASKEIQGEGALLIDIPEGLHLNTNSPPARWLIATELVFEGANPTVEYPAGVNDRYEGPMVIPFRLNVSTPTEFELRFKFQACTNTECRPAEEIVLDGVFLP